MDRVLLSLGFFRKMRKLRREVRRLTATVDALRRANAREVRRLNEIIATQATKIEIVQREAVDRVLESQKLIGFGFATRDTDDRMQRLRYQPFEEAKRAESGKGEGYHALSPEQQLAYDTEYENHVALGVAEGLDAREIERNWKKHQGDILEHITSLSGS